VATPFSLSRPGRAGAAQLIILQEKLPLKGTIRIDPHAVPLGRVVEGKRPLGAHAIPVPPGGAELPGERGVSAIGRDGSQVPERLLTESYPLGEDGARGRGFGQHPIQAHGHGEVALQGRSGFKQRLKVREREPFDGDAEVIHFCRAQRSRGCDRAWA
jgi:hypothetical protein